MSTGASHNPIQVFDLTALNSAIFSLVIRFREQLANRREARPALCDVCNMIRIEAPLSSPFPPDASYRAGRINQHSIHIEQDRLAIHSDFACHGSR
jgi:hypothetical protein